MRNLWRDIQFGLRMLARNKGFTAVAILVLALGIGPNAAIFSIVWATLLAPLPYPQGDQLVVAWNKFKGERVPTRADDYLRVLAESRSFQCLDFLPWKEFHFTSNGHQDGNVSGYAATPTFNSKDLTVDIALGRHFLPEEGVPGKDHVVIFTHRLWQGRYHGDPRVLGKQVEIEGLPYTVVGVQVAQPQDRGDGGFNVPLALNPGGHNDYVGNIFGRLKSGVTLAQAQAELALIDQRMIATRGGSIPKDGWTVSVEPLHNDWMDKKFQRNLWLLLAGVCFVLLIACANLANLLLARGSSRQQELAVRAALGATRRQVFVQLLTESLTLALLGGASGIALGWSMMKLTMTIAPDLGSSEAVVQMNLPVLYFAIASTLLAGLLAGCAPAWHAAKLNLSETLKQGSRSVTSRGRLRTQAMLVIAEFALALTLLAGAGMALHSFWNLTHIDLGFRTDHILMGELRLPKGPPPNRDQTDANAHQLLSKVGSLPGVLKVAMATNWPLDGHSAFAFNIVGRQVANLNRPVADLEIVTPGYFDTFGVRLLQGRFLNEGDRGDTPQVVVVSEGFVRRYLQGVNPLDQRLLLEPIVPGQKPGAPTERQIVGVFHDVRNGGHLTDETAPAMFIPFWQNPWPYAGIVVRTSLAPELLSKSLSNAVEQTLPGCSLTEAKTMQQTVDNELTGDRFGMLLFGAFAALALLLAALGIYGVMAFAVAQRNHEMGLRMALGAQQSDIVRLILVDGMKLTLIGVGIGLIGVLVLGRLMHSTLYGIKTVDAESFAIVAAVLLAVAMMASYIPAQRSAKVDPMVALRQE